MIDLGTTTLKELMNMLSIPTYYLSSVGMMIVIIRYFGNTIFKSVVEKVVKGYYDEVLHKDIETKINKICDEKEEEIIEKVEELIKNHEIQCRSKNTEVNDQRYLLRQEFKMFLDSQAKTNEKLETAITEIRSTCNQILLKLTE